MDLLCLIDSCMTDTHGYGGNVLCFSKVKVKASRSKGGRDMENDYTKRPGAESDHLCSRSGARLSGKPHHPKTISPKKHGILPRHLFVVGNIF